MWKESLAFAAVLTSAALVYGAPAVNPWPTFNDPAPGPARSIGEYASGCLQGAEPLPLDGVGYQVMRPGRKRYFGHPELIDYISLLGQKVHKKRLGVLLVGDLSHARGGRASSGHASHQTGLDVDVWFAHPERARRFPLPLLVREELVAESVVDSKRQAIVPRWKKHVTRVLRLAADDERVERVFVNPAIKRELCQQPAAQREWLRKIRPWYGHADHFHARLGCMPGDSECQSQAPLPPGDGCDKLTSWIRPKAKVARKVVVRKPAPAAAPSRLQAYRKAVQEGRGWPASCEALLTPTPSLETPPLATPPKDERIAMPTAM